MIIADVILLIICLAALIFAFFNDIKVKEVPDWLNFALISIALGVRLIHAIVFSDWWYFLYGLIGLGAMFALGVLIYYTKQWGGGDAKLLMGLGAVFGTKPYYVSEAPYFIGYHVPFLVILLFSLLLIGAVYGLLWGFYLFIKHRKAVIIEFFKILKDKKIMRASYFILAAISIMPYFFFDEIRTIFLITSLFLLLYPYLFLMIKSVENVGMLKYVPTNKLVEGDWVAKEVRVKGKLICGPKDLGLEKKQILALKRANIKRVLIKEGIAFVPSIFLGTVFSLFFTDLLLKLL
ncbi:MAG: A24 family peptidase [Candidatus Woesearchaeota archaeon]